MSARRIDADDPRLRYWAPQPVARDRGAVRLERFARPAIATLGDQVGPLANVRSSSGCAVVLATDSPWIECDLVRLRHHQPTPVGIDAEVHAEDGVAVSCSDDLRAITGDCRVRLATGRERGMPPVPVWVWLPLISTCAVRACRVADGASVEPVALPEPRWLALGDSLTQGFCVQQPTGTWVHRLQRRWALPGWNLGVGGLRVEPALVRDALAHQRWDLITIGLGSNHAWSDADRDRLADRAADLCTLAAAHAERVVWLTPPWKPLEDGRGPPEFMGVPLDARAAERLVQIRADLERVTAAHGVELCPDVAPRNHRLYPDGLHPAGWGMARIADGIADNIDVAAQK